MKNEKAINQILQLVNSINLSKSQHYKRRIPLIVDENLSSLIQSKDTSSLFTNCNERITDNISKGNDYE